MPVCYTLSVMVESAPDLMRWLVTSRLSPSTAYISAVLPNWRTDNETMTECSEKRQCTLFNREKYFKQMKLELKEYLVHTLVGIMCPVINYPSSIPYHHYSDWGKYGWSICHVRTYHASEIQKCSFTHHLFNNLHSASEARLH